MPARSPSWPRSAGWSLAALFVASVCEGQSVEDPAHSGKTASDAALWHAGVEVRPGYAVRPLRIGGGIGHEQLEARLVFDPLAFVDGIHDLDVSGAYRLGDSGYSLSAGWRATTVFLTDGSEWQHSVLLGALARLPTLGLASFRALFGLELSAMLFRHGGGVPAQTNCFCDGVIASETLGFATLLKLEYAPPR